MTTTSRPTRTHGRSRTPGDPRRAPAALLALAALLVPALASAGAAVTALALLALAAVMASVQGAIAPFSSLLPMLPLHPSHGELADVLEQIRQRLAHYPDTGERTPPALQAMVGDFARYHAVIAVAASLVTVVLAAMSAAS